MCEVITQDGTVILCPTEIYLDSNDIRGTVKLLVAESTAYKKERQMKRKEREKNKHKFWK